MSPAGKGSPGKGGKAPAGKAKGGKGGARGTAAPAGPPRPMRAPSRGSSSRGPAALKAAPGRPARPSEPPRLRTRYASELKGALQKDLGLPNPMLVPRMEKIVINMGVGKAGVGLSSRGCSAGPDPDSRAKAIVTKARKSIAAFKLRRATPSAPR